MLFALGYYLNPGGVLLPALPAMAVHEFGHMAALRVCGARIKELHFGFFGLRMDYRGELTEAERLLCAAAGPAAGLLLYAVSRIHLFHFIILSGQISLALSIFNVLPILPLDGGRVVAAAAGQQAAQGASRLASATLVAAGIVVFFRFGTIYMFLLGTWLFLSNWRGAG